MSKEIDRKLYHVYRTATVTCINAVVCRAVTLDDIIFIFMTNSCTGS